MPKRIIKKMLPEGFTVDRSVEKVFQTCLRDYGHFKIPVSLNLLVFYLIRLL